MPESPRQPNILFVFADQMRGTDMGCAGNSDVITPVLDRMARDGAMATNHAATCPICSPNRATMLTGLYPTTHGLLFNDTAVRTDVPTLGTLARLHGYRTGYIGKWHIDGGPRTRRIPPGPRRLGFDDFWAALNCRHRYFEPRYYRDDDEEMTSAEGYQPEVMTNLALEFLDTQPADRPFCLAVSFGPPHNPYEEVPDRYREMYDQTSIRFRPNCGEIPREVLDPAWSHRPTTRDYYAQITSLDEMLGRMLERLEGMGVAEDTIVVFTSDHGDMLWSQGLLYKCVPYHECINVPLLIRYPAAVPGGLKTDAPVGSVDLLPTLAGLCGWAVPPSLDGTDCSGPLRGEDGPLPEEALAGIYHRYVFRQDAPVPEWRGLRTRRYTYSETVDREPWLVFDNVADPFQQHNLADDPAAAGLREELHERLRRKLEQIGDPFRTKEEMARLFPPRQHAE